MVSRLVASVWCKPTRAAGVRRAALHWAVRRMALHTMAIRAAAAGVSLCFDVVCHSPSRSGSLPCLRGDSSARRRVFSFALCAARGQRVLRGTEWTLCAPIGCVALLARRVRFWRCARYDFIMVRVRPQPFLHCARTCCSQRGPVLAALLLCHGLAWLRAPVRRSVGGAAGRALPFA